MNINKILPAILKLQQPKHAKQQPANQKHEAFQLKETARQAQAAMSTTKGGETKEADTQQMRPSLQNEILYLPLPLKSDYFKSALFYLRKYSENKSKDSENESSGLFIKLDTYNLGILWVALFSVPTGGLVVRFFADSQPVSEAINGILPEVTNDLKSAGYKEVAAYSHVQPNIRQCQDIDPAAANAEVIKSLLDWEV
ncbi:MAG: hypothetical protein FH758_07825 [Firmicutes bacterium]|nr:hypothetical protein [Bacillota bacterium]